MTQEEKVLILGALFHDIGKFWQRGDEKNRFEKHQLLSSSFVNDLFNTKYPSISKIVLNHHQNDLDNSDLKGKDRILAEILCEADNIASMERKPDQSIIQQQPFESIFSKVDFNQEIKLNNIFQPISDISYADYKFAESKFKTEELNESYKVWWNKFNDKIKKANKDEFETLYYILKKYLWCVPSSSWKTRSDVSLFEHSRITAAIAISMFKYLFEKSGSIDKIDGDHVTTLLNKLVDHIQAEKSYFKGNIKLHDLRKILFMRGRINNERIQSQSGAFLLFGHDAVLPETTEDFPLDRVEVVNKANILKELARLNITESTVYPSMEKTASEIAKKYISGS